MVVYTSDKRVHGKSEYWSKPEKVNGVLRGDCEDYALAK